MHNLKKRDNNYSGYSLIVILFIMSLLFSSFLGCSRPIPPDLKEKISMAIASDAKFTNPIFGEEAKYSEFNAEKLKDICDKAIENRTSLLEELRSIEPGDAVELKKNIVRFFELENEAFEYKKKYIDIMDEFLKYHDDYEKGRVEANRVGGDHWAPYFDNLRKKLKKTGANYRKEITNYRNVADRLDTMGELITEDLKAYRIKALLSYAKFSGLDDASFLYWRRKVDQTLSSF
ncbi:MAG: hypothetical protein P9L92_20320 [Candidatus Electryonea clarkiae]|nr:hypothetical protein [Candidatus Electryonea clarkiae]MDP8286621.1 hypothetical protein [Candidatus Electryonea clarkiae]